MYRWLSRDIACPGPHLTLITNPQDFAKAQRKFGTSGTWPAGRGSTHMYKNGSSIACIVTVDCAGASHLEIASLLVHEASHVVDFYFESIGEENPASGQRAYALQFVSKTLFEEYRRQGKLIL